MLRLISCENHLGHWCWPLRQPRSLGLNQEEAGRLTQTRAPTKVRPLCSRLLTRSARHPCLLVIALLDGTPATLATLSPYLIPRFVWYSPFLLNTWNRSASNVRGCRLFHEGGRAICHFCPKYFEQSRNSLLDVFTFKKKRFQDWQQKCIWLKLTFFCVYKNSRDVTGNRARVLPFSSNSNTVWWRLHSVWVMNSLRVISHIFLLKKKRGRLVGQASTAFMIGQLAGGHFCEF